MHIRALKQTLNHKLLLKKAHRLIQFNKEAQLKISVLDFLKVANYFNNTIIDLLLNK